MTWHEIALLSYYFLIRRISDRPKPFILDEDVDVTEERERIYKSEQTNDILRIRDLSKVGWFASQHMTHSSLHDWERER